MKSGTNALHGSGYDYFVNEVLNAGLPFTDAGTQNPAKEGQHIRNAVRRNDYGFTVGGPVRIPKVYNGTQQDLLLLQFRAVPRKQTISNGLSTVPTAGVSGRRFFHSRLF